MIFGEDLIANEIMLRNNYFFTLRPRAKKGGSQLVATALNGERKMKKLMFAAAVAAGLAAFGDGIESANTVGYQEKDLTLGNNDFVIQTFLPMGKTTATTKLGDIKVTDDWDPLSDFIATLQASGDLDTGYTYLIKDYAEALGGEVAGWYLADEVNDGDVSVSGVQNDVVISAGQAFLIYQNTGATISLPSAL